MPKKILITGGAGFIGATLVRQLIAETDWHIINIDKLTYAGNLDSLTDTVLQSPRHQFVQIDICDLGKLQELFRRHEPHAVMHLAAESHVDRSIDNASAFVQTNVVGTYCLLEAARQYCINIPQTRRRGFRFYHISTDEVFGSLDQEGLFSELTPYRPNSPYSASKAASDHFVRAWHATYGLPIVITNCSNNYGPYQFPEKLIPLTILSAIAGKPLPVYGDGGNVRDWLYVEDHCRALRRVLMEGANGETYNIGGRCEKTNLEVVNGLCGILDEVHPRPDGLSYRQQIKFVPDRPGHDRRYAMNISKIAANLNWTPQETFDSGLRKTVQWYLNNRDWCARIEESGYKGQRLGLVR